MHSPHLNEFNTLIKELSNLLTATNVLFWDSSTKMPAKASSVRGDQIGTLQKLAQEKLLSPIMQNCVEKLMIQKDLDEDVAIGVKQVHEAINYHKKLPLDMIKRKAKLSSDSESVWLEARKENNFKKFAPYLTQVVDLQRELNEIIGYKEHPYEVPLAAFEPGISVGELKKIFEGLKEGLVPLAKEVHAAEKPDSSFLYSHFPPEGQRKIITKLTEKIGYDYSRGRLDTTTHPFAISMTPFDARITTRFTPNFLNAGLFGGLHEAGHAIYEQSIDPSYVDTPLSIDLYSLMSMGGASYSVHESQSRLWENRVGRSFEFWQNHYHELQQTFPDALGQISLDNFYKAINRSEPSLIRVEADELTYDLHIMLRSEIEIGLMDGSLSVAHLPEYWRAKIKEYLGIEPQTDTEGVLQDVHWSKGYIGYFPSYTLGNILSAQFMECALHQAPEIASDLKKGSYSSLKNWLEKSILQHARKYSTTTLISRVTEQNISAQPYITYLNNKFKSIYELI